MGIKEIKKYNDQQFLDDLKIATSVMVYASITGTYLSVMKKEVFSEARNSRVRYYMTDKVFTVKRTVMVII